MPLNHDSHGSNDGHQPQRGGFLTSSFWKSKAGLVFIGFLLIGLFFLLSEHRAHALGYLPFLLILACPLLHLFMHGGHGGHGSHGDRSRKTERPTSTDEGAEP
jgi:hypothetical protein